MQGGILESVLESSILILSVRLTAVQNQMIFINLRQLTYSPTEPNNLRLPVGCEFLQLPRAYPPLLTQQQPQKPTPQIQDFKLFLYQLSGILH
jgi:hypothetical protein